MFWQLHRPPNYNVPQNIYKQYRITSKFLKCYFFFENLIVNDFFYFLTGGTGKVELKDINKTIQLTNETVMNGFLLPPVFFTLDNVSLTGVDTQNHVDFMNPIGNK